MDTSGTVWHARRDVHEQRRDFGVMDEFKSVTVRNLVGGEAVGTWMQRNGFTIAQE